MIAMDAELAALRRAYRAKFDEICVVLAIHYGEDPDPDKLPADRRLDIASEAEDLVIDWNMRALDESDIGSETKAKLRPLLTEYFEIGDRVVAREDKIDDEGGDTETEWTSKWLRCEGHEFALKRMLFADIEAAFKKASEIPQNQADRVFIPLVMKWSHTVDFKWFADILDRWLKQPSETREVETKVLNSTQKRLLSLIREKHTEWMMRGRDGRRA